MGISLILLLVLVFLVTIGFNNIYSVTGSFFTLDSVGVYLSVISIVFTLVFVRGLTQVVSRLEVIGLCVSVISSVVCFTTNHCLVFWVSYELTIIPLVCCLICTSPYSERFLAVWYLVLYVLLTSLPMLIIIVVLAEVNSSYLFTFWGCNTTMCWLLLLGLLVLFITKVPLPPFHSWLPIVHAEASTYVSVVLSGYVMKLGVVGLLRFCGNVITSLLEVIILIFMFSLLFFVSSASELDNKRWLAFLSLSHIMISIIGVYWCPTDYVLSLSYCVGHGISAGLLFYSFMVMYNSVGTRNWLLIGQNDSISLFWRILMLFGFLSVASLPPSISFITELHILGDAISNVNIIVAYALYLLVGGVIPMVLLAYIFSNNSLKGLCNEGLCNSFLIVISLYLFWFLGGLA